MPTEAGVSLLQKAQVQPEDILVGGKYNKEQIKAVKSYTRSSPVRKFYDSPGVEIRLSRTHALLKVAGVIAREKLDEAMR